MNIETLGKGRFLELKREGHWEYVSRLRANGAAFIVAVTPQRELVLVEQYRIPVQARTIELPAGIVGDEAGFENEEILAAALRELEEETGFRGARAELLLESVTGAGLTSEHLHLVRIRDLQRVHAGGGVEGEDIVVHRVALSEVHAWLQAQAAAGKLVDARIYAGLWFAERD